MEIQNTQVGQAFASPSASTVVGSDLQQASETGAKPLAIDRENKSTNTEVTEPGFSRDQISAQVSRANADNKTLEDKATLAEAAKKVESFLQTQNRDLAFSIDEDTNRSVVTVKDSQSDEIIRQIPSEEVLELAERIRDLQNDIGQTVGMFIDRQV
ncbi:MULTISPECIES: flagellar protein FlaG [unclassified Alteromonas]|uniref:flagellar protein FlaG n=1 Tax=unclassified Alteromonas TaxID=2614992 RepID=UPI0005095492|nr:MULTISPECIES: flagellar protein FlaG [unclassified Alteromonas]